MIILITGASHTGKTVLAQRMLEKYKSPYLSIDHLKMGLIRCGNTAFGGIKAHGSDIENRFDDSECTVEQVMKDNRQIIAGYNSSGEKITLISDNYEDSIRGILN